MWFSEARRRRVVSTTTADTLGRVDELLVDPRRRAVVALHLTKSKVGDTLEWSDVLAFGDDAVTVSGPDKLREASEEMALLAGKDHRLVGKRVLSTTGDDLGEVVDVDFDPTSGRVVTIQLYDDAVEGERLVGVGSYAVVVEPRADPTPE